MLEDLWARRGPAALALWPISQLYAALVLLRKLCFRYGLLHVRRLPVPVVVVGNVVVGGAGKTPVVIALARHLLDAGHHVGVISRGYGRRGTGSMEVTSEARADQCGDEPLLIKRKLGLPVFVGPDRAGAALQLLAAYPATTVIISDDGLQHLALERDIEICVFDPRGLGNGFMLPAGPLREPWPRTVDLVVDSGSRPQAGHHAVTRKLADQLIRADGSQRSLLSLHDQPVVAVAAIANPEQFFNMLRERGLRLLHTLALPDHHDFHGWSPPVASDVPLIFTEKDATKLWAIHPEGWAAPLEVVLAPQFLLAFDQLLSARLSLRASRKAQAHYG